MVLMAKGPRHFLTMFLMFLKKFRRGHDRPVWLEPSVQCCLTTFSYDKYIFKHNVTVTKCPPLLASLLAVESFVECIEHFPINMEARSSVAGTALQPPCGVETSRHRADHLLVSCPGGNMDLSFTLLQYIGFT